AAQQRMVESEQLGRQEALQIAAEAHVEDLLARPLEAPAAERERLLAHATDERGELPELRVGCQSAAEFELPGGRASAGRPAARAPAARRLARLLELAGETRGGGGERSPRARGHLAETLLHLPRLLPQAGLGGGGRVRGVGLGSPHGRGPGVR